MRRWHEETWPAIRAKVKRDGGEILFADQVGNRSDQVTGRTWGEKGRTPVVRRSGNRFSVNAMSAISTKGRMHFMVFTESLTAEVMCRFLDRLAAHPDDVELHFLPPYAPELNPDELVNADLKHSLPKQHRARDQAELAAEIPSSRRPQPARADPQSCSAALPAPTDGKAVSAWATRLFSCTAGAGGSIRCQVAGQSQRRPDRTSSRSGLIQGPRPAGHVAGHAAGRGKFRILLVTLLVTPSAESA